MNNLVPFAQTLSNVRDSLELRMELVRVGSNGPMQRLREVW